MDIQNMILDIEKEVIELRRYFHMYPEKSWDEFNTQKKIIECLENYGISYRKVKNTGVIGWIKVNEDCRTIGIRADIDALEMEENTDLPFKSKNVGIMHSCGHDSHIAMLLGTCKILAQIKDKLKVNVVFIFQPAEEFISDSGARYLKEEEEILECDNLIAIHIWPSIPVGYIALREGPVMASADTFDISIKGKGGHGAMIHENINPIVAGNYIVNTLINTMSLKYDSQESAVISITAFQSGQTYNITPETAVIKGTTRSFNPNISEEFERDIKQIVEGIESLTNTKISLNYYQGPPVMINDKEVVETGIRGLSNVLEDKFIIKDFQRQMGGEDFAKYNCKKAIAFLGGGKEKTEDRHPLHSPEMDIDERALKLGVSYFVNYVLEYQKSL